MQALYLWFDFSGGDYLQITQWQIGFMPAPPGRSDALTQSTRLSNWKRSFYSICTSLGTADSRSPGSWIWPRGRSKSGFRTGAWRWRKWTKKRATAKNNNVDCKQKTNRVHNKTHGQHGCTGTHGEAPSASLYIYHFVGFLYSPYPRETVQWWVLFSSAQPCQPRWN